MKDIRLKQRLIRLVEQLSQKPTASVPLACGNWAQTKASYRFWDNKKVEIDEIITAHKLSTLDRAKDEEIILAIQDTTDLDFSHHPNTAGLGHLDAKYLSGLKVHSVLAASTSGVPLGILAQEIWARDPNTIGKKHQRKQKETHQKESQRWLDAEQKTVENLRHDQTIITVADREADIFDLFSQVAGGDGEFLIRACHNRCVPGELSYLIPTIEAATIAGYTTVNIGRNPVNAARDARLSIQFMTSVIHSPAGRTKAQSALPVTVNVILATECILETDEWQALACHHLAQGEPPVEPPTLSEAVLMLARLGGFLARRGDGVPGVKTIWRGFSRLTDLVAMWRLLHQPPHPT